MRRGGSIYVSTDPIATLAIGTPGVSISIGLLGPTIYGPNTVSSVSARLISEDSAFALVTEDGTFHLTTEA